MSGVIGTVNRLEAMVLAFTGIEVTGALVVPDHFRDEVANLGAIRGLDELKIGIVGYPEVSSRFHERVPNVEVVELESNAQFFEGRAGDVTGLVTIAEAGAAWTMRYPHFQVVVPQGVNVKAHLVYPIAGRDLMFRGYVERWAILTLDEGTVKELYDHWILGRGAKVKTPRWSVIRNVLRWVD